MAVTREILERRWARLREAMAGEGLDALVVVGRSAINTYGSVLFTGGFVPMVGTCYSVVRAEGEPVLFVPSHHDEVAAREAGVDARVGDSAAAAAEAARGARRVGGAGLTAVLTVDEHEALKRGLEGAELVDASALVAGVKAHKEEWDLAQLRAAFNLADLAYEAAPELLRPGVRAQDAVAELERIVRSQGGGFPLVFVESDAHFARRVSPTTLRAGDVITVLIEVANEDGYWVEQGGQFSLGEPTPRGRALSEACYGALGAVRDAIAPGAPVARAAELVDEIAAASGFETLLVLGHGIGLDSEPPRLLRGAAGVFEVGQVISVHPSFEDHDAGIGGTVADGFLVTESGCESLAGIPYELTVLS